jgi:hypothetical protein
MAVNWGHAKARCDHRSEATCRRHQGVGCDLAVSVRVDTARWRDRGQRSRLFVDYDLAGRFSLVELVGIKQLLEHRLGVPVDVTTRDSLDPLLRGRIEASAERIF